VTVRYFRITDKHEKITTKV